MASTMGIAPQALSLVHFLSPLPLSDAPFSISLASFFFIYYLSLLYYLSFLPSLRVSLWFLTSLSLLLPASLTSSPLQPQEDTESEQAIVSQPEAIPSTALPCDSLSLSLQLQTRDGVNQCSLRLDIRLCHKPLSRCLSLAGTMSQAGSRYMVVGRCVANTFT